MFNLKDFLEMMKEIGQVFDYLFWPRVVLLLISLLL